MKCKYIDADRLREAIDAQRQKMVITLYEIPEGDERGIRVKGMHDAFVDSLALIDKIQQERPMEGLEEAAGEYASDSTGFIDMTAYRAFLAGAEWMKAKILEKAAVGRIAQTGFHNSIYIKDPIWSDTVDKFNAGDKVRIIIIKEDEKP